MSGVIFFLCGSADNIDHRIDQRPLCNLMKNGGGVDGAFVDAIIAPAAALSGSRKQQYGGRAVVSRLHHSLIFRASLRDCLCFQRPVPPLPGGAVEGADGARGRVANRLGDASGSGLASSGYRQIGAPVDPLVHVR